MSCCPSGFPSFSLVTSKQARFLAGRLTCWCSLGKEGKHNYKPSQLVVSIGFGTPQNRFIPFLILPSQRPQAKSMGHGTPLSPRRTSMPSLAPQMLPGSLKDLFHQTHKIWYFPKKELPDFGGLFKIFLRESARSKFSNGQGGAGGL